MLKIAPYGLFAAWEYKYTGAGVKSLMSQICAIYECMKNPVFPAYLVPGSGHKINPWNVSTGPGLFGYLQ